MTDSNMAQKKQLFHCDYCGEKGHKMASCFKLNPEHRHTYQVKKELSHSDSNGLSIADLVDATKKGGDGSASQTAVDPSSQSSSSTLQKENVNMSSQQSSSSTASSATRRWRSACMSSRASA